MVIDDLIAEFGRADALAGKFPIDAAVMVVERHVDTFPLGDGGGMVTV